MSDLTKWATIDEIYIFFKFQLSGALKILMYYQIMNVVIIIYMK
jgi:hypothetical protein